MSGDPYVILGVKRDATQEEIQKAYRALAKKLHPDLNPGNDKAEAEFKEVTRAYNLLGDAAKRKRFDDGEIDEQGADRPPQRSYYRDFADSDFNHYSNGAGFSDFEGAEDILSGIFERGAGERGGVKMRGASLRYHMRIEFLDAINGAKKQIQMPEGGALDITIPAGARDGQVLRLRGKGRPGHGGGPPGDALIEIEVAPHRLFRREGDDIHLELPISLREAVLGGPIRVPTPTGFVEMKAPPWSNTGAVLRLRGKGAPGGDEYVTLKVMLPEKRDPELEALISNWRPALADDPRAGMEA